MSGSPLDPLRARSVFSASPVLLTSNGPLGFRTGSSPNLLLSPFWFWAERSRRGKGVLCPSRRGEGSTDRGAPGGENQACVSR